MFHWCTVDVLCVVCRVRDTTDVQPLPTSTGVLVKMELGRVSNNNNILVVVSVLLYIWIF